MKKLILRGAVPTILLIGLSVAYGGVPGISVTVSDAGGKAAFKGVTNAVGTFETANLKPGNYVVQFNSNNAAAVKGKHYALVVSAGAKKVSANAVPGEKFARGGVAMKVEVGRGLNIQGQVASASEVLSKEGKKMVWIPPQLGTNRPGHWAEEGSTEAISAKTAGNVSNQSVSDFQQRN